MSESENAYPTVLQLEDSSVIVLSFDGYAAEHRVRYRYEVVTATGERFEGSDLRSGSLAPIDTVEGMRSLLTFMGAQVEAMDYERRTGSESENASLFAPELAAWIDDHSSELEYHALDLEEVDNG